MEADLKLWTPSDSLCTAGTAGTSRGLRPSTVNGWPVELDISYEASGRPP